MSTVHKGWQIRAHRQIHYPPYLDFVAFATKENGEKVLMFNVEGKTLEDAVHKAKQRIDGK